MREFRLSCSRRRIARSLSFVPPEAQLCAAGSRTKALPRGSALIALEAMSRASGDVSSTGWLCGSQRATNTAVAAS